jgi:hypothetical protein
VKGLLIAPITFALALGCGGSGGAKSGGAKDGAAGDGGGACACPATPTDVVHLPLACLCPGAPEDLPECHFTLAQFEDRSACVRGLNLVGNKGCDREAYALAGALNGTSVIFSTTTRAFIGVYLFSSVRFGPCDAPQYVYGQGLFPMGADEAFGADRCADVASCFYCGSAGGTLPACY